MLQTHAGRLSTAVFVAGAVGVMIGISGAKAQEERGSALPTTPHSRLVRVYEGASDRGSIQEALDRAVASADGTCAMASASA